MISQEAMVAALIFVLLGAAALCSLLLYDRLPRRYHHEETGSVVRLVSNLFVMMTSLVLGLMVNSAKNTFEAVDHNVHVIATEIILLDRTLRQYGPMGDESRQHLRAYTEWAVTATAPAADPLLVGDRASERLLLAVGTSLGGMRLNDDEHAALWHSAREGYQHIVELRWALVEQAEGTIPMPFLAMVVAWLVFIFASFGYRSPRNVVVVGSLLLSAGLIAGSIYLILDMDVPFSGLIQVEDTPMRRALAEMAP
ncbi:hypothetical protein IBL26_22205 [Roseomonas aerophila]|uniref:DUF4239 domain-containing protein n=1 Tax=Teichococcus aerophilus TaxID=1224513 RepID=A0ABR7RTB2_9PROT|nr:hypothetical protein [Pseudoroseomonas aerophila]MBC9209573.1 hypothetical protein [Pseudoroseomonas aerophila]